MIQKQKLFSQIFFILQLFNNIYILTQRSIISLHNYIVRLFYYIDSSI